MAESYHVHFLAMMDDGALAVFVTPHGYGHAGRVCAVLSMLRSFRRRIRFEIYSTVPEWFIADEKFATGRWIHTVERLLERPSSARIDASGAETAAAAVLDVVGWA
jgi:hypothetical protein